MQNKNKKITDLLLIAILVIGILIVFFLIFYIYNDTYTFYLKENTIELSETEKYIIEIIPKNQKYINHKNYIYKSSNENVVTVDKKGKITPIGVGTTEIIIKSKKGFHKEKIKIVIKDISNKEEITKIWFSSETYALKKRSKLELNLITSPNNIKINNIKWSSSNENVATIDSNGVVTGKNNGEATITATIENELFATCKIIIQNEEIHPSSITLNKTTINMYQGDTFNLVANVLPENSTNKNIVWKSDNDNIVEVKNGIITAKNIGTTTITATLSNGLKASCIVNVTKENINPTTLTLNKTSTTIYIGNEETLFITILPENTTNKNITWLSSDETIATVNNGKIIAKKEGIATITAKTHNGITSTCKVTVTKKEIPPKELTLNKTSITLYPTDTYTISATVTPTNATNQNIIWTSSNEKIATVENGKITAKSEGKATITAKINNTDIKKTVNVEVIKKNIKVTGVTLNKTSETVYTNSSNKIVNLTATVYPTNADNKNISWKSSNENVATVNNGKVTAKAPGTATITVTTKDGGFNASYKLTVKKKVIVVITASQGVRMNKWFESYISKNKNYYSKSDNTLKYIYLSGSGFDFQYGDGLTQAINYINEQFSSYKNYVDLNIYFTLTGNSVKLFTCNEIQTTDEYINIAKKYNESIQKIKNLGYPNVQGHVISHSPLNTKHPLAKQNKIVYSHYEEACKSGYRSAWKYYLSNNRAKPIINSNTYSNIKFVDNWSNFLIIKDEANRKFTWLQPFSTPDDDPLHWDEPTTKLYMQMAFDTANM